MGLFNGVFSSIINARNNKKSNMDSIITENNDAVLFSDDIVENSGSEKDNSRPSDIKTHNNANEDSFKWVFPDACTENKKFDKSFSHKMDDIKRTEEYNEIKVSDLLSHLDDAMSVLSDTREKMTRFGYQLSDHDLESLHIGFSQAIGFYREGVPVSLENKQDGARLALIKLEKIALMNRVQTLIEKCSELEHDNDLMKKYVNVARPAHYFSLDIANKTYDTLVKIIEKDPRLDEIIVAMKGGFKTVMKAGFTTFRDVALLTYGELLEIKGIGYSNSNEIISHFESNNLPALFLIAKSTSSEVSGGFISWQMSTQINEKNEYIWRLPNAYGKGKYLSFRLNGYSRIDVLTEEKEDGKKASNNSGGDGASGGGWGGLSGWG